MCCSAHSSGEDFDWQEERGAIRTYVQEELGECEDRYQTAGRAVVKHSRPYCIKGRNNDAAVELLFYSADPVREKDPDVEARKVALFEDSQYTRVARKFRNSVLPRKTQ